MTIKPFSPHRPAKKNLWYDVIAAGPSPLLTVFSVYLCAAGVGFCLLIRENAGPRTKPPGK
ncbi:Uncharacterized protein APZ42_019759 [Daphnia magna]|uniref:Uncharacterized protein n=1 Tax=Daphnia magna TaxID=35525 RepID=A0A164XP97_9CRUS|nr:Uncharacterized protein APZ42_019759 [Daphnia magna]